MELAPNPHYIGGS